MPSPETMSRARKSWKVQGFLWPALAGCLALACAAQASEPRPSAVVATSSVRLELSAGSHAPRLVRLAGHAGSAWRNRQEESLPASVEVNGATRPLTWHLKPGLGSADAHHAVFVYESTEPHLRLRWQWDARAGFGPVEHRITIENLGGQEVWLPLFDSLSLDWRGLPDAA